jgi:O-6-methylguanine DNA methyltransferase
VTPFAKKVYKIVLSIPLGEVRTYKWVAQRAGRPRAYRAVGQVLKRNPYPFLIPCHRVVASSNKLGGYSRGVKLKKQLLILERKIKELMI